jgi:hypothetical protein
VLLTTNGDTPFFTVSIAPRSSDDYLRSMVDYGGRRGNWRVRDTRNWFNDDMMQSYFTYLRQINKSFDDNELLRILKAQTWGSGNVKKSFIQANPPVNTNNRYKAVMNGNTALLINTAEPRNSFKVSDQSGKLIKANVPSALARQLLGGQVAAVAATPTTGRRGRPAGQANAPRPAAAPAAGGDINVSEEMDNIGLDVAFARLPRSIIRRLNVNNATRVDPNNDRGASRRNNLLGNAGRVGRVIQIGASKIYIIRLANQQIIASINVQPGNSNYVLTGNASGNNALSLNSPSDLLQALQQRGLAEVHNYLVNEYLGANPTHLDEFKQILRKHINEKNEQK